MRAYHLEAFGDIDGIVLRDGGPAIPEPAGPNDIVVAVKAASLNRRDLMILQGRYPLPAVPGGRRPQRLRGRGHRRGRGGDPLRGR
ncbi:hypothetical protein ACGFYU_04925 [Streptomyces sp. NPDC048337]|uniref:hypothetical protein n=1 Tax=Streptomyces sp. NPDC048337 TaxID=3365535 RepID=UPI00371BA251